MLISKLQLDQDAEHCQLSAFVQFEQQSKQDTVYFRVPVTHLGHIRLCYDAFLFALLPIALVSQEERIHIDGPLCPESLTNAISMLKLFQLWYHHKKLPVITALSYQVQIPSPAKAALFISAGVDSLANYCRNVHIYPNNHPRRFAHAFFVYGMDLGDPNKPAAHHTYQKTVTSLTALLRDETCELVPVTTNVREMYGQWRFYADYHFGPLMAGIAHALSAKTSEFSISLDNQIQNYVPRGSHPLLNKYFSSSFLTSQSGMEAYTRLEKYQFFQYVPNVISQLRVCHSPPSHQQYTNCGKCEKCIRTKLELLISGYLDRATSFEDASVTTQQVMTIKLNNVLEIEYYQAIADALWAQNQIPLANLIQQKLAKAWRLRFKHRLLEWDHRYFNQGILNTKLKLQTWFRSNKPVTDNKESQVKRASNDG